MENRQLFKDIKLFKKEVAERFLSVTQSIYKNHPVYTYADDETDTSILIYVSYADIDKDGSRPRFVIKVGGYKHHLMDTTNRNFSREIEEDGHVIGQEYEQLIPVTLSVLVQAYTEEESSDLADELTSLVGFASITEYSTAGLIIIGINVSETDQIDREQDVFQTSLTISFEVPWKYTKINRNFIGPPRVEMDTDRPILFNTYRQPGVVVTKEQDEED